MMQSRLKDIRQMSVLLLLMISLVIFMYLALLPEEERVEKDVVIQRKCLQDQWFNQSLLDISVFRKDVSKVTEFFGNRLNFTRADISQVKEQGDELSNFIFKAGKQQQNYQVYRDKLMKLQNQQRDCILNFNSKKYSLEGSSEGPNKRELEALQTKILINSNQFKEHSKIDFEINDLKRLSEETKAKQDKIQKDWYGNLTDPKAVKTRFLTQIEEFRNKMNQKTALLSQYQNNLQSVLLQYHGFRQEFYNLATQITQNELEIQQLDQVAGFLQQLRNIYPEKFNGETSISSLKMIQVAIQDRINNLRELQNLGGDSTQSTSDIDKVISSLQELDLILQRLNVTIADRMRDFNLQELMDASAEKRQLLQSLIAEQKLIAINLETKTSQMQKFDVQIAQLQKDIAFLEDGINDIEVKLGKVDEEFQTSLDQFKYLNSQQHKYEDQIIELLAKKESDSSSLLNEKRYLEELLNVKTNEYEAAQVNLIKTQGELKVITKKCYILHRNIIELQRNTQQGVDDYAMREHLNSYISLLQKTYPDDIYRSSIDFDEKKSIEQRQDL